MAYDDTLIVDYLKKTHDTTLLSEREKHLVGLSVTMTRGCQVCTRNWIGKARDEHERVARGTHKLRVIQAARLAKKVRSRTRQQKL